MADATDNIPLDDWGALLTRRPLAEWRMKLAMGLTLPPLFTGAYLLLQYVSPFRPVVVPQTAVDRMIGFDDRWVWPYASLYVFILIGPGLATTRDALRHYVVGLAAMTAVCLATFFFVPTIAPRSHLNDGAAYNWLYRFIVWIDREHNACPSLHAGLVIYTLLFMVRVLSGSVRRGTLVLVMALAVGWAALILLGTLGTRQHRFLDLVAGGAVALVAHLLAWRWWRPTPRDPAPDLPGQR